MTYKKILIGLAIVSMVVVGTHAFAGWGMGGYGHGRHHESYGPGGHRGGYGSYGGYNAPSGMSQEDWKKMDEARQAFFKDTESLRRDINEKQLALQSELAKETPDKAKASEIQKGLSDLEAQFDQKRLDNMIKMRDIAPYAGRGYMRGGPMMGGPGGGPMMGRGRGYMAGPGRGYGGPGRGSMPGPGRGYGGPGYCWQ